MTFLLTSSIDAPWNFPGAGQDQGDMGRFRYGSIVATSLDAVTVKMWVFIGFIFTVTHADENPHHAGESA